MICSCILDRALETELMKNNRFVAAHPPRRAWLKLLQLLFFQNLQRYRMSTLVSNAEVNTVIDIIQVSSSVAASVCGLSIHSYILFRIFTNYLTLTQYQNLIVVQSGTGIVSCLMQLFANRVSKPVFKQILHKGFHPKSRCKS